MTFPTLDTRDYIENIDASRPVEKPKTIWSVYYKGNSGNWIFSLPSFYKENAEKLASVYASSGREVRILQYTLDNEFVVDPPVKKVKKIKKVRKVVV